MCYVLKTVVVYIFSGNYNRSHKTDRSYIFLVIKLNNVTLNHFTFKSHCFWYLVSAMACSLSSSFLLVSRIRCSTGLLLVGLAFCYHIN